MVQKYFNTNVQYAAKMMDITDEDILSWSNGEVSNPYNPKEKGGLMDPQIFGKYEDDSTKMGHITLSAPIVNINYVRKHPDLHNLLDISSKDLDCLIYFAKILIVKGEEFSIKSVKDWSKEAADTECQIIKGAEAVEYLLKKKEVPNAGKYVLHFLPVLPLHTRYVYKDNKMYTYDLHWMVRRVLFESNRIRRLLEIGAPCIILDNEKRMLQEYADIYINNGMRGLPFVRKDGGMGESLAELYNYITAIYKPKKEYHSPDFSEEEIEKITKAVTEYQQFTYPEVEDSKEEVDYSQARIMSDEEAKQHENEKQKLTDAILDIFEPIVARAVQANLGKYGDFEENIYSFALSTVMKFALSELGDLEDLDCEMFANAITTGISCYIEKQHVVNALRQEECE